MGLFKIRQHLDREMISYTVIRHAPAFTAQKTAAAAHVPGREVAKTVIVKLDGKLAMAVLPAHRKLDLDHLREAIDAEDVELASEWEFKDRFCECEAGAMPPLGQLYGLPVYVSDELAESEHIAFPAGNHGEMIRMRYADFGRMTRPRVLPMMLQRMAR